MSNEENQLSMAHVQYPDAPGSIFGPGDEPMIALLEKSPPLGKWIDCGAGDGRYAKQILKSADSLVAFDIDPRALDKLRRDLDEELRDKLILQTGDLNKTLPFADGHFDGAFCSSTIHQFSERTIRSVFAEMLRIVRPGGRVLVDFFHDIERVMSDGNLYIYPGEISYDAAVAKRIIDESFSGRNVNVLESRIVEDFETDNGVVKYKFNGNLSIVECAV